MAMLASTTVSCSGGESTNNDTSADTGTTTTDPVDTSELLELPADLNYNNKTITILTAEGILAGPDELTEETDTLGKALYERTMAVEDRLGVDIKYISVNPWEDTQNMARQSIGSQSDDYQLIFTCAQHMINLVNEGLFLSHNDLPYIDIDKPWWNKEYIESVSLHADEQYILFGDITHNTLSVPAVYSSTSICLTPSSAWYRRIFTTSFTKASGR